MSTQRHIMYIVIALVVIGILIGMIVLVNYMNGSPSASANLEAAVVDLDGTAITQASISVRDHGGTTGENGIWSGVVPQGTSMAIVSAPSHSGSDPERFQDLHQEITTSPKLQSVMFQMEGWSQLSQWSTLRTAIADAANGPSTTTITWSVIPANTPVTDHPSSIMSVEVREHFVEVNPISSVDFASEISLALGAWKELLESLVPNLTINFVQVTEPDNSLPGGSDYVPSTSASVGSEGRGHIRMGMCNLGTPSGTLALAYTPQGSRSWTGPIWFNSQVDWRQDSNLSDGNTSGGISIQYITAHEVGHTFGLGHDAARGSLMYPTAVKSFVFGQRFGSSFRDSTYERAAIRGSYLS